MEQDPELLGLPPLVQEDGGEVRLAWRPANLCVLGHVVKVWAVRHLRTEVVIGEAADPEAEPLVFEEEMKREEGDEAVVNLGDRLDGCLFHRLEVCSIVPTIITSVSCRSQASILTGRNRLRFRRRSRRPLAATLPHWLKERLRWPPAKVEARWSLNSLWSKKCLRSIFTQRCYVGLPVAPRDTRSLIIVFR